MCVYLRQNIPLYFIELFACCTYLLLKCKESFIVSDASWSKAWKTQKGWVMPRACLITSLEGCTAFTHPDCAPLHLVHWCVYRLRERRRDVHSPVPAWSLLWGWGANLRGRDCACTGALAQGERSRFCSWYLLYLGVRMFLLCFYELWTYIEIYIEGKNLLHWLE